MIDFNIFPFLTYKCLLACITNQEHALVAISAGKKVDLAVAMSVHWLKQSLLLIRYAEELGFYLECAKFVL
jgi:hypothetical protein